MYLIFFLFIFKYFLIFYCLLIILVYICTTQTNTVMKTIKAKFQDEAGFYTMTFSFNADLWSISDILKNECQKSNAKFIQFLYN
jgi:hypothetical protein